MPTGETYDSLYSLIKNACLRLGNPANAASGAAATASVPVYVDSSSNLQAGNIPFAIPLMAGVTSTAFSVMSVEGSTTGAANVSMTQTLVQGASASLTTTGFLRVTITDDAGNLTNGAYYIPFGTLA